MEEKIFRKFFHIKGVTDYPQVCTRIHGKLDAKKSVVYLENGEWLGHNPQKKVFAEKAFIDATYAKLEKHVKPLYEECAQLEVKYYQVKDRLAAGIRYSPNAIPSIEERTNIREIERLNAAEEELGAIALRIAKIDAMISDAVIRAAAIESKAAHLTEKRIQAYFHGAASFYKKSADKSNVPLIPDDIIKTRFAVEHERNDKTRNTIIDEIMR